MTAPAFLSSPSPGSMRHLAVFGVIALFLALGTRTLVAEDARLGWGMFSYQVNYDIRYEWVLRDRTTRVQPALDLHGKVKGYLDDSRRRRTRYGLGGLRSWLRTYTRHVFDKHCPDDAIGFRAVVDYDINGGTAQRLIIVHPEKAASATENG